jgi:amidase
LPAVRQYAQPNPPTPDQLRAYAAQFGFHFSDEDAGVMLAAVAASVASFEVLEALPDAQVPLKHPYRDPGHTPYEGEDPYNAFIRFCEVRGAETGPLAGKTLGVKDCIAVAGVPMTDGGRRMPYLVPTEDAVVVERLLDAGATITGKTNLEDLALGLGESSHFGAALNPHNPRFSTGGSSSGSGAAVASGAVDIALGADEGGSVRIPAAWCGLVGMKATHGLVPSHGLSYMDHTIDHIGPMTKSVDDNALVLEIIAGPDWRDPQWVRNVPEPGEYRATADLGIAGLRIGVISESLEPSGVDPDVAAAFAESVTTLEKLGAKVETISFPTWTQGALLLMGAIGMSQYAMWLTQGQGFGHFGRVDPGTVAINAAHARLGADDFPPMLKTGLLTAAHMRSAYLGTHYAKAHNLRLEFRKQLSELFNQFDLLITPTTPKLAFELLDRKGTLEERMSRVGYEGVANTAQLDLSGHPALSVPNGVGHDNLPTGLQIIGPHFGEATIYRAAYAFEQTTD